MERFDVYLNYAKPGGRKIAITSLPEMRWEATIEEELAYGNPPRQQTDVFHGHSKAGNVTGPLIYANYGSREDFKKLKDSGISLKGAIALVRYYGTQGDRALKVKAAELIDQAQLFVRVGELAGEGVELLFEPGETDLVADHSEQQSALANDRFVAVNRQLFGLLIEPDPVDSRRMARCAVSSSVVEGPWPESSRRLARWRSRRGVVVRGLEFACSQSDEYAG